MKSPHSKVCVICAIRPSTTRDHVPPKGWFKGLRTGLITVPACYECNQAASNDDENLRFYLSVQVGMPTQAAALLWDNGAHKSILRKSKLRVPFLESLREVTTTDAKGNLVKRLAFPAPLNLYQRVFERIVRGLYFHHSGKILPPTVRVLVEPLDYPNLQALKTQFLRSHEIGAGACVYYFAVQDEDLLTSLWVFEFHKRLYVRVITGRLCEDDTLQ